MSSLRHVLVVKVEDGGDGVKRQICCEKHMESCVWLSILRLFVFEALPAPRSTAVDAKCSSCQGQKAIRRVNWYHVCMGLERQPTIGCEGVRMMMSFRVRPLKRNLLGALSSSSRLLLPRESACVLEVDPQHFDKIFFSPRQDQSPTAVTLVFELTS